MTVKKIKMASLASVCFYVFWITLMIGKGLGFNNENELFRYITVAVIPFIAVKFLLTHWEKREFIVCVALNVIGIAIWLTSKDAGILLTIITITACKDINIYKLFKVTLWIRGPMFFVRTTLGILGIIDIQYRPRYLSPNEYYVRYALGYGQANATHYTLFIIIALTLILYHKRMNIFHYAIVVAYDLFIYHYTNSRTALILSMLILVMTRIIDGRYSGLIKVVLRKFGKYAYIVGATCGFAICLLSDKLPASGAFGTMFSRFRTGGRVVSSNQLALFGTTGIVTDFGYIAILYGSGIIIFILFLVSMTFLFKRLEIRGRHIEQIVLIAYAIYTVLEAYTGSILMNMGLFFLTVLIYPHNEEKLLQVSTKNQ